MPELPEVETIVKDLKKARPLILGACFIDVWTDTKKLIKKPGNFSAFKKQLFGLKIQDIWRRGKNIIFELSGGRSLLIHQKLTGHLLYGNWKFKNGSWQALEAGLLEEKINQYIHLLFWLDNGKMLGLSDLRKFAKVELWNSKELKKELKSFLGSEPLDKDFNFGKFQEVLKGKKGLIKKILMDQKIIVGIGNIYSDEILWEAKVSPFKVIEKLNEKEIKCLYDSMKEVLKGAVELRGTSISDYRDIGGEKGFFDKERKVYRREGQNCFRCGTPIVRKKTRGRSAHFCPNCQPIINN